MPEKQLPGHGAGGRVAGLSVCKIPSDLPSQHLRQRLGLMPFRDPHIPPGITPKVGAGTFVYLAGPRVLVTLPRVMLWLWLLLHFTCLCGLPSAFLHS